MAAVLLLSPPLVTAKDEPKPTKPTCSVKCPEGYRAALFKWELRPERTVYDEAGVEMVAVDGIWTITCWARCELKVEGEPIKIVETDKKQICKGGAEPIPYVGPWRRLEKWDRDCAAIYDDACGFTCYPIKKPPPPKKKPPGKAKKK
jgi:hypothetical protein